MTENLAAPELFSSSNNRAKTSRIIQVQPQRVSSRSMEVFHSSQGRERKAVKHSVFKKNTTIIPQINRLSH